MEYALLEYRVREHEILNKSVMEEMLGSVVRKVVRRVRDDMLLTDFAVQEVIKTEVPKGVPLDEEGGVLPEYRCKCKQRRCYSLAFFFEREYEGGLRQLIESFEGRVGTMMPFERNGLPVSFCLSRADILDELEKEVYMTPVPLPG